MSMTTWWADADGTLVSLAREGEEIGGNFVHGMALVFTADSNHVIEGTPRELLHLLSRAILVVASEMDATEKEEDA